MALNGMQIAVITESFRDCKQLTDALLPSLQRLNIIGNAAGGLLANLQQADLDAVNAFSGITVQQVKDVFFVLTGAVLNDVNNSLAQLQQGSART